METGITSRPTSADDKARCTVVHGMHFQTSSCLRCSRATVDCINGCSAVLAPTNPVCLVKLCVEQADDFGGSEYWDKDDTLEYKRASVGTTEYLFVSPCMT